MWADRVVNLIFLKFMEDIIFRPSYFLFQLRFGLRIVSLNLNLWIILLF